MTFLSGLVSLLAAASIQASVEPMGPSSTLRVAVSVPPSHAAARVHVDLSCDEGEKVSFELACEGTCVHMLPLPRNASCAVQAAAQDLWAPKKQVVVDADVTEISVALVAAGRVVGTLVPPRGLESPSELAVTFQKTSPLQATSLAGEVAADVSPCAVAQDGSFSCVVPAGEMDLKLRAPGFASAFRWSVPIESGEATEIGPVPLIAGASIAGWVTGEDPAVDLNATRVLLRRPGSPEGAVGTGPAPGSLATQGARPDSRGFFQFSGLPPGLYELVGTHPGCVTVVSPIVEVEAGIEAILRSEMVLTRPSEIEVQVTPPLDPERQPWRVDLHSRGHAGFSVDPQTATVDDSTGSALIPGVAPGDYWLDVSNARGERYHSEEIVIGHAPARVEVAITTVSVAGILNLGGRPLQARMEFSSDGRSVALTSDSEGRFDGVLPGPGTWQVRVFLRSGQEIEVSSGVDVPAPHAGETAELEIELPGLSAAGRVVSSIGEPVAAAIVDAQVEDANAAGRSVWTRTPSDSSGAFELVGLPPGRLTVSARKEEATSGTVEVRLIDGLRSAPVELVLEEEQGLAGIVLGPAGPVASAQIMVVPVFPSSSGLARVVPTLSDANGRFTGRVPSWASAVDILVFPAGYPAAFERFALEPDRELAISVQRNGGVLRLSWTTASGSETSAPELRTPRVIFGEIPLLRGFLVNWARVNQGGFWDAATGTAVIPKMPPGPYALCRPDAADSPPLCSHGVLQPLGELPLHLD